MIVQAVIPVQIAGPSKCRDKLIAYTSVFAAVKQITSESIHRAVYKVCEVTVELADGAHRPVL